MDPNRSGGPLLQRETHGCTLIRCTRAAGHAASSMPTAKHGQRLAIVLDRVQRLRPRGDLRLARCAARLTPGNGDRSSIPAMVARPLGMLIVAALLAGCGPHRAGEFSVASAAGVQTGTLPTLDEVWDLATVPMLPWDIHATADDAWAVEGLEVVTDVGVLRRVAFVRRDVVFATVDLPVDVVWQSCACPSTRECWCAATGSLVQFLDGRRAQEVSTGPHEWRSLRAASPGRLWGVNLIDQAVCVLELETLTPACAALPGRLDVSGFEVTDTTGLLTSGQGAFLVTARTGQAPVLERVLEGTVTGVGAQGGLFAVSVVARGSASYAILDQRGKATARWSDVHSTAGSRLHALCPVGPDALVGAAFTGEVVLLDTTGATAAPASHEVASPFASIACR